MDDLSNALAVSVREANDIMFNLWDESEERSLEIEGLEQKLDRMRLKRDAVDALFAEKREELRVAGFSFNLGDGVYRSGERPGRVGRTGTIRDQEGY